MSPYAADGVDITLIRWMLSMTPSERLDVLQSFMNEIIEIREYIARNTDSPGSSGVGETQS
jgi:hypothetical protein